MKLSIRRGRILRPRRCLVYGVPGIGKTFWAAKSWSPLFIPTEEGCNDIDVAAYDKVEDYDHFLQVLDDASRQKEFKTLVIDTVTSLEPMIERVVCQEKGVNSIGDLDYGAGYVRAGVIWRDIISRLESFRDLGMMVMLIGHAETKDVVDPACGTYTKYQLRLNRKIGAMLTEWCDEVFFAFAQTDVLKQQQGFQKTTRAVGGQRKMCCQDRPFATAKNRLGMPEICDFDFGVYASAIKEAKNGKN